MVNHVCWIEDRKGHGAKYPYVEVRTQGAFPVIARSVVARSGLWLGCDAARSFSGPGGVSAPAVWLSLFGKVLLRCEVLLCGF